MPHEFLDAEGLVAAQAALGAGWDAARAAFKAARAAFKIACLDCGQAWAVEKRHLALAHRLKCKAAPGREAFIDTRLQSRGPPPLRSPASRVAAGKEAARRRQAASRKRKDVAAAMGESLAGRLDLDLGAGEALRAAAWSVVPGPAEAAALWPTYTAAMRRQECAAEASPQAPPPAGVLKLAPSAFGPGDGVFAAALLRRGAFFYTHSRVLGDDEPPGSWVPGGSGRLVVVDAVRAYVIARNVNCLASLVQASAQEANCEHVEERRRVSGAAVTDVAYLVLRLLRDVEPGEELLARPTPIGANAFDVDLLEARGLGLRADVGSLLRDRLSSVIVTHVGGYCSLTDARMERAGLLFRNLLRADAPADCDWLLQDLSPGRPFEAGVPRAPILGMVHLAAAVRALDEVCGGTLLPVMRAVLGLPSDASVEECLFVSLKVSSLAEIERGVPAMYTTPPCDGPTGGAEAAVRSPPALAGHRRGANKAAEDALGPGRIVMRSAVFEHFGSKGAEDKGTLVDGVPVRTLAGAILHLAAHEVAHVLAAAAVRDLDPAARQRHCCARGGHTWLFDRIVKNVFGHPWGEAAPGDAPADCGGCCGWLDLREGDPETVEAAWAAGRRVETAPARELRF